ncbi:transcription factor ILR3 isoform X2 [Lathyrus oleraceus]|uniref:transcription factor ILR3 isoform X2 n=1 Tax=Pisum sativum TaxID=3888 RepID=UPI0021CE958C|nr:transcription factor ILR3-like isoform X2 [Pisum sativum]
MVSRENNNWLFDYGLIDDISPPISTFMPTPSPGFTWPTHQPFNVSSNVGGRSESCAATSSKACREKLRRDRLNDKFIELGSILEPGRPAKTDKAAILMDAVRMVTQLKGEAEKLKDANTGLQEKIKELKVEKNELRDEKQRLKAEKEKLEQQLKSMNAQPSFLPPPTALPAALPAGFAAQGQAHGNKLVPFISYPGVAMWQFMPPAAVDTSQDHVLRPPVA